MHIPQKVYGTAKGVVDFASNAMNNFTHGVDVQKMRGEGYDEQRQDVTRRRESRENDKKMYGTF